MDGQRQGEQVVVETGLDEVVDRSVGSIQGSFRVHARTRRVRRRPVEMPKDPQVGDEFTALTVRARLMRYGRVWQRVPHTPDTRPQRERSCMPEPVREMFKDRPAEPMRIPVASGEMTAVLQLLDAYLALRDDGEGKALWWAIADVESDREMAKRETCHHATIARRKQSFLERMALDWNARGWRVDRGDASVALRLIHRKK